MVHLNQYIIQLWMFATPVVWPLSQIPAQWKWIALANPMSVPVEGLRICLLGVGTLSSAEIAVSVAVTLLVLFTGIAAFQKVERTVIDSV
jgi:lipopolysaccharide transport system permease protein